ncbi:BTAD domain-containing putative transcriptional regulator [Micromonospora sp. WMMD1120]|uniref:AfsR/SARP family transcriptional regulator n=1 Tax=Micromonospora sp. WMMD1120 TaxID=3016106 RepID=UPI002417FC69|nr:BTAD domain-containing putative transcriptional regulator [Micromonospora sp. WMMD1120]MDG4809431.1 BTAD domain-containing putative transcriptional regulator [Micromonospora sp. WMMD1120]
MRWSLLGPVQVTAGGRVLPIDRPQQRAVLALLLLNPDRLVPLGQLVSALWADDPPASARTQVQVCVSRIRAALREVGADHLLTTQGGGYRLTVPAGELDLAEFTAAVERARAEEAAGRGAEAARLLRDGLALWRGPALAGAAGAFVDSAAAGLDEQRLLAYERLAAVELDLGRFAATARALRPLVAEHPLREPLVAGYLLALAGCGQQAAALRLYAQTRRHLVEELGVEPGPELSDAHLRVLRGRAPAEPAPGPPAGPRPAQLPGDPAWFTGRTAALRQLDALLPADPAEASPDGGGGGPCRAVVISAIAGTAGVGKTTLAVHWAHRVAHRYPDGQLYVNLRGFDLDGRAVSPGEALRGFLEALHVPPQRMPTDLAGQAALFRTLLADRRVLVLLDNARDDEQVRPLLPGSSGSLVVVTSRHRLTGLVVNAGAHPVPLDLLPPAEARELLIGRLGRGRAVRESAALDEIVRRCAGLPLALAVVAARAVGQPDVPLSAFAAELRDTEPDRLTALTTGDPVTDVRAVFSWSYRALDADSARLFRLLGLHPGPDAGLAAVASLAGLPPARVAPLLADLTRANLLTERVPGRYAMHDLLRAYASELCHGSDPEAEREAARRRLFDHYLHGSHAADQLLDPYRLTRPAALPPPQPGVTVGDRPEHAWASAWFAAEHHVLLACVERAAGTGLDRHAWTLAATLTTYLDRSGHWPELAGAQRTALAAALRRGDRAGQALAHRGLAIACTWSGEHEEAHRHYRRDLELYRELGDDTGRAHTHIGVSWVLARQGRLREALNQTRLALDLYRATGSRVGQAKALNNLGWMHARLGEPEPALRCCQEALRLHAETGDRHGAALTWDSLGYVRHGLGDHDEAADCYRRALALHRELGDRYDEAEVLDNLGDSLRAAGDLDGARRAWREALTIFDELRHPDADRPRLKLTAPAVPATSPGGGEI